MNELKDVLNLPFGVCDFALVQEHLINCRKKSEIPENAKSIILFTFPYKVCEDKPKNISRYAAVDDYHPIIEKKLNEYVLLLSQKFPENIFVPFVDNSPVPEVFSAAAAGLGVVGENGLLITEEYGSFVFIGEIVTDMYIPAENKAGACLNCGLCKKACPVGLNKENCLSAVTQKKKPLCENEERLIRENGSVWGCDICAEVCPLNKNKKLSNIEEFINSYRDSFAVDEDGTNRPYLWRGKDVILRNHNILCKE